MIIFVDILYFTVKYFEVMICNLNFIVIFIRIDILYDFNWVMFYYKLIVYMFYKFFLF